MLIPRRLFVIVFTISTWSAFDLRLTADEIVIHCDQTIGSIRPLHGVNGGPLSYGGTIDLSDAWRELAIPITRLHDCDWPNPAVVDLHTIFPDPHADPSLPGSYRFTRTDDYLQSIAGTGASVVFRLGESIEHSRRKYHVDPPADPVKWADTCRGVIRHINEGWAEGTRRQIRYWEIWNEPENRPVMWTGSDEDYFRLYLTASTRIKAEFPDIKVGGPAVGATGEIVDGEWKTTDFLQKFIERCRAASAPLDFFSWHTYSDDPRIYAKKARAIRQWLDRHGFAKTEIHLNEWNFLPDNDCSALSPAGQGLRRQQFYEKMGGPAGAAFVASVLIDLQDSPVDVANYFCGDSNTFGLFTQHGVPKKTFYAMKAFRMMFDTPQRLAVTRSAASDLLVLAGRNAAADQITILVGNPSSKEMTTELRFQELSWASGCSSEQFVVDAGRSLDRQQSSRLQATPMDIHMMPQSVTVVRLKAAKPSE